MHELLAVGRRWAFGWRWLARLLGYSAIRNLQLGFELLPRSNAILFEPCISKGTIVPFWQLPLPLALRRWLSGLRSKLFPLVSESLLSLSRSSFSGSTDSCFDSLHGSGDRSALAPSISFKNSSSSLMCPLMSWSASFGSGLLASLLVPPILKKVKAVGPGPGLAASPILKARQSFALPACWSLCASAPCQRPPSSGPPSFP